MSKIVREANLIQIIKDLESRVRKLERTVQRTGSDGLVIAKLSDISSNSGKIFVRNSGSSEVVTLDGDNLRVDVKNGASVVARLGEE